MKHETSQNNTCITMSEATFSYLTVFTSKYFSLTFNEPGPRCSPASANTIVANTKWFRVIPGHKRGHFTFPANSHRATHPADPEATILCITQDVRCLCQCFVWLLPVSPDSSLRVAPASDKNLKTFKMQSP